MAILYGTQSNGETLPVLVDEFGNLLAKGIEGPPGPPGVGSLPPNPYEGAVLGWEGGELAWISQAVVVPEGTFGPYTYFADEHRLEVPQDTSQLIAGRSLFMSDNFGKQTNTVIASDFISNVAIGSETILTFATDKNLSKFAINNVVGEKAVVTNRYVHTTSQFYENFVGEWYDLERTFDGGLNSYAYAAIVATGAACYFVYDFDNAYETVAATETVLVRLPNNSGSDPSRIGFSDGSALLENHPAPPGGSGVWLGMDVSKIISSGTTTLTSISANTSIQRNRNQEFGSVVIIDTATRAIRKIMDQNGIVPVVITDIDMDAPSVTTDGGSFYGSDGSGTQGGAELLSVNWSGEGTVKLGTNGDLLLEADNGEWEDGFYVTAPEEEVAAWKVVGPAIKKTVKSQREEGRYA